LLDRTAPQPSADRAQYARHPDLKPCRHRRQSANPLSGHHDAQHEFARILTAIDLASDERDAGWRNS